MKEVPTTPATSPEPTAVSPELTSLQKNLESYKQFYPKIRSECEKKYGQAIQALEKNNGTTSGVAPQ